MIFSWLKRRRRRKLLSQPFPIEWLEFLAKNVWHCAYLSDQQRAKLRDKLRIMVAEKNWEGCGGLVMTDEIKVTIAAQASLMLLGIEDDYCFDGVQTILVYPTAYMRPGHVQNGLIIDEDEEAYGEAWHRGPIVLSWQEVLRGGRKHRDGQNLVLHEFAHHLDGLDGGIEGVPPLSGRQMERRWYQVTEREYRRLCGKAARGEATLLDHYGASNKAEFFAVATECFFERPHKMKLKHAELYEILQAFYRQDPAGWQPP